MTKKKPDISGDLFAEETSDQKYVLRLYVAGMTPKSTRAIKNITRIYEEHLAGRYDLQ